jgi:membrane protease YdiL (CAAX protease family)
MGRINRKLVVVFYGVMLLIAVGWAVLRGTPNLFVNPEFVAPISPRLIVNSAIIGVLCAGILVVLSQLSSEYFEWARRMEAQFVGMFGSLSNGDIVLMALASGIAEEAFFRGAMQPTLGLTATSILFGIMHIGPNRDFIPWTISALVIGFVLGYFFQALGTLTAPIICHVLVNLVNLMLMRKRHQSAANL